MELNDIHSNSFLSDVLSHKIDQIKLGKLKLVDPAERKLADQERMTYKQRLLEKEMYRAHLRNKKYSPLLST